MESSNPLVTWSISLGNRPPPGALSRGHLINISSGVVEREVGDNYRDTLISLITERTPQAFFLRALVPQIGPKTNQIFLIINRSITRVLPRTQPSWHPDLGLSGSRTVRSPFVLSHPVCGGFVRAAGAQTVVKTVVSDLGWLGPSLPLAWVCATLCSSSAVLSLPPGHLCGVSFCPLLTRGQTVLSVCTHGLLSL